MGAQQSAQKVKIDEVTADDETVVVDPASPPKDKDAKAASAPTEGRSGTVASLIGAPPTKKAPQPLLTREARLAALIEQASSSSPPALAQYLTKAKPFLVPAINMIVTVLNVVGPMYMKAAIIVYDFCKTLPWDLLQATLGIGLCFFGGGYCASIAAAEAFYMTGWFTTRSQLELIYRDALAVAESNKRDDEVDADGDGIADVKQIETAKLVERKMRVAAVAIKDPQRLAAAAGGLYASWLAVQGVLRVKFARTVSVAVAASQFVEYYACKALLPILTPLTGPAFRHWLPIAVKTGCKAVFVGLAWWMQTVVSAVQSALRGGLMFSRAMLSFLNKRGVSSFSLAGAPHPRCSPPPTRTPSFSATPSPIPRARAQASASRSATRTRTSTRRWATRSRRSASGCSCASASACPSRSTSSCGRSTSWSGAPARPRTHAVRAHRWRSLR